MRSQRFLIDVILVVVTAAVTFCPTYFCSFKPQLVALKNQIVLLEEQIASDNAWEYYDRLQVSVYQKWAYLEPRYEAEFKEIEELACQTRQALVVDNDWDEANRLITDAYEKLATLPGPPTVMIPFLPRERPA